MVTPSAFEKELTILLNKNSIDSQTNTPDFILAAQIMRLLEAIRILNATRDDWHGFSNMSNRTIHIKHD